MTTRSVSVAATFRWLLATLVAAVNLAFGAPLITEFMASNATTLRDEDGDYSDWIEIHNPDTAAASLAGWHLTDAAGNKTKWTFPAGVSIPANGYLIVFASNKNRGTGATQLHTNFALSSGGEYLGLIQPDGTTVVSEFAPTYTAQSDDTSYGVTQPTGSEVAQTGYFTTATPGTRNGGANTLITLGEVTVSVPPGTFQGQLSLQLSGAASGEVIRYTLTAPSAAGAAAPAPTATSPAYTAPLLISESTIVKAAVFLGEDGVRGPVATAHYARISPELAGFTGQLPIIVLDNHGLGAMEKDDIDRDGWMHVFTAAEGERAALGTSASLVTPVEFKVRGSSSALFPKKGYNVELKGLSGGDNPQPLLGLPASEDWAFVSPWFYDPALIRNALAYSLSNQMGRWAPRTRFVELFINADGGPIAASDYYGVTVVTDRILIGENRVDIAKLSPADTTEPAITGGYILKLDGADPDEYAFRTDRGTPLAPDSMVVVARPKLDDLSDAQRDYIRTYVQSLEDAIYADLASGFATRRYRDYIDVESWVDLHLFNIFLANPDAMIRSVYFTKDRNGKLVAGPAWDFDRAAGSKDERSWPWDQWEHTIYDAWAQEWWGPLLRDPDFMQAWIDRWQSLRRSVFSDTNLAGTAEYFAGVIGTEAAGRDAARWPDNRSRYGGDFTSEVAALKDWLVQRAAWLDAQFLPEPTATFGGGSVVLSPPPGAVIVYTLDGSDPRGTDGTPASGAIVSSDPVTLPDGTDFRARSYDESRHGTFPGSGWSSAISMGDVRGDVRLVNVSSRAYTGSGENVVIAGLVVAGDTPQRFLARAVGPTLGHYGVTSTLRDPRLQILDADGKLVAENQRWDLSNQSEGLADTMSDAGAFPLEPNSADAALVVELPPGRYSMIVSGANGERGIALAELYEVEGGHSRAINLSTRARVHPGEGQLIGGIAISGDAPQRVLIRAIGPSLEAYGINDPLPDPVLTIRRGSELIAIDDDWIESDEMVDAFVMAGAFPLAAGSRDAALVLVLPPGNYTAQVEGKDAAEGVALVEVYELP